jgi:hypothetical protein
VLGLIEATSKADTCCAGRAEVGIHRRSAAKAGMIRDFMKRQYTVRRYIVNERALGLIEEEFSEYSDNTSIFVGEHVSSPTPSAARNWAVFLSHLLLTDKT